MTRRRLPAPAGWLMRRIAPDGHADGLVDDLEDDFARVAAAHGRPAAYRRLLWEIIHAIRPIARTRAARVASRLRERRRTPMHGWIADARHALRRLSRTPGFTLFAAATLAIGIGATSAIFSLAYAIWLKPLPYAAPDRLVSLHDVAENGLVSSISGPELDEYRRNAASLSAVAGYASGAVVARIGDEPIRFMAYFATPNLFQVLGVRPALGRDFTDGDAGAPVVMLSDATWASRFGRDPGIVGRSVLMDAQPHTVIGVMPRGFHFPTVLEADGWVPSTLAYWTDRDRRYVQAVARLAPEAAVATVDRELSRTAADLAASYPASNKGWTARAQSLDSRDRSGYGAAFGALLGMVGLFLLITSVNLAGLLLARTAKRRTELAVCLSIGARPWQLGRQLVFEALALAAGGCAGGILIAGLAGRLIARLMPPRLPGLAEVRVDGHVLAFSIAVTLATAAICGVISAMGVRRLRASEALAAARSSTPRSQRLQRTLVVGEVALALLLLVGASLMARSLFDLINRDRGFDPHGLLTLNVSLPYDSTQYETPLVRAAAFDNILDRVGRVPGIRVAGATNGFPGSPLGLLGSGLLPVPGRAERVTVSVHAASPRYFAAMGVPLRAGRAFTERDRSGSAKVAIVGESLAKTLWPEGGAIGRQVIVPPVPGIIQGAEPFEVVGVVGDLRTATRVSPDIFVPLAQAPTYWIDLVARTGGDPAALREPVRRALRGVSGDLLIENVSSLDTIIADAAGLERAQSGMAVLVAVLSTLVAGLGLYALLAQIAAQRTRELGIRLALGSNPARLFGWMFRQGMVLTAVGLAAGGAAAVVAVRLLRHAVFGLGTFHPSALALAAVVLAVVSAAASAAPARRVMRTDPLEAMRQT